MIIGIVLAACLLPPFFPRDWTGPRCIEERQVVECGCSECLTWDPVSVATHFEILRRNPDNTTQNIGNTIPWNRAAIPAWTDADGNVNPAIPAIVSRVWCPAWDSQRPGLSALYGYQVRACVTGPPAACGPWTATVVQYRVAPYRFLP